MRNNSLDKVVLVSNLVRLIRQMEEYEIWKRAVFVRDRFFLSEVWGQKRT